MKPRATPIVLVLLTVLVVSVPAAQASRTAPQLSALRAAEVPSSGLSRRAFEPAEPPALGLLSASDRAGLAALASLDEPRRIRLLTLRRLRLAGASIVATRGSTEVTGTVSLLTPPSGSGGDLQGYEHRILLWTPDDPAQYLPGEYTLTIILNLADPAGHPIHAPPSGLAYRHQGQSDIVWSEPSETPILAASTAGNDRHLHGRPYLPELGLYDYRARFYEPATSSFLEPDPLGPVDSPNLYQAFGFDGLNVRNPWGECKWNDWECWGWVAQDFAAKTGHDLWNVATLGIPARLAREYKAGNVKSVGDATGGASDALTNVVTLGARDQYESGATTGEVLKEISGVAGIERGSRMIGEGIGLGDADLALRGVGEFAGGTGQLAGWAAGATALGKRALSAASMGEVGEAAQQGIRNFGKEMGGPVTKVGGRGARYVYDAGVARYRDLSTGRFVAQRDLPYPPNRGFASRYRAELARNTVIDRYGRTSGRNAGTPGATISERGMPPGSEALPYARYRVLRPFEAWIGTAAPVPEFGASGGATQIMTDVSIQQLVDRGYLEKLP